MIFIFFLFCFNVDNVNAQNNNNLSTILQTTDLGELQYKTEGYIKQAIVSKNPNRTINQEQLSVEIINNASKAKITSGQFSGEVQVTFAIQQRLSDIIQVTNLGNILVHDKGIKDAIKEKNCLFEPQKATINNIIETNATVSSSQGTGEVQVNFSKRPFLANVIIGDEVKNEFKHIYENIKNYQNYVDMGAAVPKGYILHGPPGTGKTYLTQQLKEELGDKVHYEEYVGPEFISDSPGVGETKVRSMFQKARSQYKTAIIVIDEIDSILSVRGSVEGDSGGAVRAHNSLIDQFLAELDGLQTNSKPIVVIGITNKEDILDAAVTRPGRLEKKILIDLPDRPNTCLILEMYLKKIRCESNCLIQDYISELTDKCFTLKMSPASIKYFTQEAARIAVINQQTNVSQINLKDSLEKYEKEQIKKVIKLQNLANPNFDTISRSLLYATITTLSIFVIIYIYFIYTKYQKKSKLKRF
ncbi:AAA family ATPase [Candidatus Phytoplasma solani]|uniref:AAA family ATPase n=1 Tax=Candidatus Phytoplasma solani TaxID=69896 RepID=UPI0032DA83C0